jgi:hypothetical protein
MKSYITKMEAGKAAVNGNFRDSDVGLIDHFIQQYSTRHLINIYCRYHQAVSY